MRLMVLCCLFFSVLFAESKVLPPASYRGIVLLQDQKQVLKYTDINGYKGIDTSRISLPGPCAELERLLFRYVNDASEWNTKSISAVKKALYQFYQKWGQPLILISVPTQNLHSSTLQLVITESRLGKVEVTGNYWLPSKRVQRYLTVKPNAPLSFTQLQRDVEFINRNPFRYVSVIYSPGAQPHTTDLTLQVEDRKPYRFYAGLDNLGVPSTGRQCVFAGFSWDQVFGLDHTFFYQYSTGYRVNQFHANLLQYVAFLPWKHIIDLYGGFSIVRAKLAFPTRNDEGTNIQASIRYHIPCKTRSLYSYDWTAGFDLKNTNNTMEFVDFFATVGQTVNMAQFIGAYKGRYENKGQTIEGLIQLVCSPAEWLPDQSRAAFESLRPQADNKWIYLNAAFRLFQPLPYECSFSLALEAQGTPNTILPSEQLGLGGYDTVRGYDQRQYNVDTGFVGQAEFHTPSFSVFRSRRPNPDSMHFLLFLDGGAGLLNTPVTGFKNHNFLLGIGPGVRYLFGPYFTGRFDLGFKLHQQAGFTGGPAMIHFSLIGSY